MWKSIRIVCTLASAISSIFCGTMKENSISEGGKFIWMEKDKNQEKEYSMFLGNIDLREFLLKVKEMGLEYW